MKIRIIIPTLFHENKRVHVYEERLDALKEQLSNYDYDIVMVCNWKKNKDNFLNWKYDGIIKKYSEDEFNIGKAVNIGLDLRSKADYYCFFSDDIIIKEDIWVKKFVDLYNMKDFNIGLIGIKGHTKSKIKNLGDVEQHIHVDGLMFFSKERLKEVGRYSEEYHYDCECQDYCLTMELHGYNNYLVKLKHNHFQSSPIIKKPEQSRKISREKLEKKWKVLQKEHEDKNLTVHGRA
ncbi:hypothetical protein CMI47_17700 [Candidatus Pacearchaeota archaeon]|jgi:hypothetical protein|nr:hypothetical protein [Candidatus Pacearchaeota archaeon]|tara:strand:+ start:13 stop:717 length:705 start_codon:yes stop_codon:yes gene_type:complete